MQGCQARCCIARRSKARKRPKSVKTRRSCSRKLQSTRQKACSCKKKLSQDKIVQLLGKVLKKIESALSEQSMQRYGDMQSCPCLHFLKQVINGMKSQSSERSFMAYNAINNDDMSGKFFAAPCGSAGGFFKRHFETKPPTRQDKNNFHLRTNVVKRVASSKRTIAPSISSILFPSTGVKKYYQTPEKERKMERKFVVQASESELTSQHGDYSQFSYSTGRDDVEYAAKRSLLPSVGRQPTFIAMVKTAIRDLRPFRMTNHDAISRYIHLRYRVRNDRLLRYILNWMVKMKILCNWNGHYLFTKKRLVKKTTVAVLRKSKLARRKDERKRKGRRKLKWRTKAGKRKAKKHRDYGQEARPNRESLKRLRKRKRKNKKRLRRVQVNDYTQEPPRKKTKHHKSFKKNKARPICEEESDGDMKKKSCTCSKEISSAKNRVKLRSRYVRRGGKIYKEEEYI